MSPHFTCSIDWLTITGDYPHHVQRYGVGNSVEARAFMVACIARLFPQVFMSPTTQGGGRFYDWYFDDRSNGVRFDVSSRMRQGWMLQLRGTWCRSNQELIEGLIESLSPNGLRITRCDVAVDVFETETLPREIFDDLRPVAGKEPSRKLDLIVSTTGETLAIGSRDSRFYMRAYDKGAEQGTDFNWLRLELEIKQDAAHRLVEIPKSAIVRGAAAKMLEMIEGHESDLSETLSLVADGADVLTSHSKPDKPARERWFVETVLPAFMKLCAEDINAGIRVRKMFLDIPH